MNEIMLSALEQARRTMTENIGGPFGAAIIDANGKVLAVASNSVLRDNDPTAHAEVNAIRAACRKINNYDLSGCVLYTTAYPCPMCLSAIIWSNIKKVYYGNTREDATHIGFRDDFIYSYIKKLEDNVNGDETLELECMDREDTLLTFDCFIEKSDKTIY